MTKNFRLKQAREKKGLSQEELAKILNVSQPYIAALEKSKAYGRKMAEKLAEALGVSADGLLTGYNFEQELRSEGENGTKIVPIRKRTGVPYYNMDITATVAESFSDITEEPEFYVDYEPFNDCTAYFPVYGNSMFPMFASGESIAVKQIFNLDVIMWGEAYMVITNSEANNLRVLKLLFPVEGDHTKIILRSSNPSFRGDTIIDKKHIASLYMVRGKVTRFYM